MSLYVRKSGKAGWIIYKQNYKKGKRSQNPIPDEAYHALGFDQSRMSFEQAKEHSKKLNFEKNLERRKIIGATRQVETKRLVHEMYLPEKESKAFENWMIENYEADEGHRRNPDRQNRRFKRPQNQFQNFSDLITHRRCG